MIYKIALVTRRFSLRGQVGRIAPEDTLSALTLAVVNQDQYLLTKALNYRPYLAMFPGNAIHNLEDLLLFLVRVIQSFGW